MNIFLGINVKKFINTLTSRYNKFKQQDKFVQLPDEERINQLLLESKNVEIPEATNLVIFEGDDNVEMLEIEGADEEEDMLTGGRNYDDKNIAKYYEENVDGEKKVYSAYKESVRNWLNKGSGKIVFIEGPGNKSISIDHFILFTYGMDVNAPALDNSNPYEDVDLRQPIIGWIPMCEKNEYLLKDKSKYITYKAWFSENFESYHKKWLEDREEIWDRNIIWFLLKQYIVSEPPDRKLAATIELNQIKAQYNSHITDIQTRQSRIIKIGEKAKQAQDSGNSALVPELIKQINELMEENKKSSSEAKKLKQEIDLQKKPEVVKGGTNPPQGEGGTTPPQGEGGTTPPQGEGGTNPPQGEGGKEKEEEKNLHASIRSDPVAREPTNAIVQNKKVEQKQEQEQNRTEQTNVVHVLHNTSKVYIPWSVQNIYIGDKENKYTKVEE